MTDMIALSRAEVQQALEALEYAAEQVYCEDNDDGIAIAIAALRERLAQTIIFSKIKEDKTQPEQEPVAWKHDCAALLTNGVELWVDCCPHCGKPRTTPPRREWVRLMRGVRVEDGTVIITVIGGNDNARLLCGELLREKDQ